MITRWFASTLAIVILLTAVVGTAAAQSRSAGETLDDAAISLKVKAKLVAERAANFTRIDVKVMNGTVRLSGDVESLEERERAASIASGVDGVKQVVNELRVKGPSTTQRR